MRKRIVSLVINILALALVLLLAARFIAFRFTHPELTETQLFLSLWKECLALALVGLGIVLYGFLRR